MKKTKILSCLTSLLLASALIFSGCSNGDDETSPKSDSTPKTTPGADTKETSAPTITSVTKDVSTFAATENLQLENYAYKVEFQLPLNTGDTWTAEIAYAENDFYTETDEETGQTEDTEEIYQLGYISEEAGCLDQEGNGTKKVNLYVYQNDNANTHSATLTIKYGATGTETTKTINLEQKAAAANADEPSESVAMKQFIGYGYNNRLGYASARCRKSPIFKVTELMSDDGITYEGDVVKIVYTSDSTKLSYREASGSNLAELEASLKLTVEGGFDIADFSGEIDAHTEWTSHDTTNYQYAWADIKVNKLTAVINTDDMTLTKKEFMTDAAYKAINGLNPRFKDNTAAVFKKLVKQYGTHVVKGGILGGKVHLDMEANTEKMESTFEAGGMLKAGYDGLFKLSTTVEGSYKKTLTSEGNRFNFSSDVKGGSEDAISGFGSLLNERTASESSRSDKFAEWQATLSEANNCVFVDFISPDNLIPLYELLDDELDGFEERYKAMEDYFESQLKVDYPIEGQARHVNTLPAKIDTTKIAFDENGSFVKDIYYGNNLVAKLCWEYIPQLNINNRVKVLYPADNNGKVFWNQGLYAGDILHKPHSVGWNGGQVVLTEKSSLDYDQYTTFYLTGTTLTTYVPSYLSEENQNKIEEQSSEVTSDDYKLNFGEANGKYNVVKIENNLYLRDYYMGTVYENGSTAFANVDGSQQQLIADKYQKTTSDDSWENLPSEYQNIYYYPVWLLTEKWDYNGTHFVNGKYSLPKTSAITGLVSRLNNLSRKPDGTVAAMFMKGGVLGLNLTKTGYIGFNNNGAVTERYYFDQAENCVLACWDDNNTTDPATMRSNTWGNLSKITISPNSGSVSHTNYEDMAHRYKVGLIWYRRASAEELRSERGPCYRVILCEPCK